MLKAHSKLRMRGAKSLTDTQQQKQINEAAEKFADAIKESYQTVAERAVSVQELNAQLTEEFFKQVINDLRNHTEENQAMTQQLAYHKLRAEEAKRTLAQESVGAYVEFANSLISMTRMAPGGSSEPRREAGSNS